MKKHSNTLTRLGHALTSYLKTSPDNTNRMSQPDRRNLPAVRNKRRHQPRRHQQYSEQYRAESVNRARTAIVNPDGSYIAIDIYSLNTANAKRRYRNIERR